MKRKFYGFLFILFALSLFAFVSCKEEEESYPYALGDIVLSDGSLVHFEDRELITDAQKEKAIGVVYYVYYEGYDDEITASINNGRTGKVKALAVCLDYAKLVSWSRLSTTGCRTDFTELTDSKAKTGTGSWLKVYGRLKDSELSADDYIYNLPDNYSEENRIYPDSATEWKITPEGTSLFEKNNYPAFYFANTYAGTHSLKGLPFAGNFHLPSIAELKMIDRNMNIVQPSLDCTNTKLSFAACGTFWSCTQSEKNKSEAEYFSFSNGLASSGAKKLELHAAACFALY